MLGTEFNRLSLAYKKSLWVQLNCVLNWELCGWSRDPEGFDSSPSFPTILLFPCHVRNCPSFLAEGRWKETYEKSLELGRGKIIRYPFFQVVVYSESINRLWKLRVCSEDLSPHILAGYHLRNSLEAPFLVFRLIFTVAFLSSFSFSAIFSVAIATLTISSFIWILWRDGLSLLWSQKVNVLLPLWFLGLECWTKVGRGWSVYATFILNYLTMV